MLDIAEDHWRDGGLELKGLMKIAIVGTGIAGNVATYLLAGDHDLTTPTT